MQTYSIIIQPEVEKDLDDIWFYIAVNDLPEKADVLCDALARKCNALAYIPERGRHVYDLENLGIFGFREIFHKPYRIIYKQVNQSVIIYGIFDGRRELKELLLKRVSSTLA